jgi:hypothetical protein
MLKEIILNEEELKVIWAYREYIEKERKVCLSIRDTLTIIILENAEEMKRINSQIEAGKNKNMKNPNEEVKTGDDEELEDSSGVNEKNDDSPEDDMDEELSE